MYRIVFQSVRDADHASDDYQANYHKYFELYIMNEDGSDVQRITENLYWENQPDVSPDGQKIVFGLHEFQDSAGVVEGTDPGWEIAVCDLDGTNLTKLTSNDYMEFMPDWNHDGTKIVYMADANERSAQDIADSLAPQYHIFTMDANGDPASITQLTSGDIPGVVYGDPSFSLGEPSKIVYIYAEGSSGGDLYTMDADGGNQELILELLPAIDSFELGLESAKKTRDFDKLVEGLELALGELLQVLGKIGLNKVEAAGRVFDPNFHEAVMVRDSDTHRDDTVVDEIRKGYLLHDKLLRPALVSVARSSKKPSRKAGDSGETGEKKARGE